jgi:hypothetical protein
MFRNHHQIYTHCEEFGVIIGQYWKSDSFWGRVNCITESGDVILDPMPMMYARHRISLSKLVTKGQLIIPVMLNPYKQWLTGKTHIQVLAINRDDTYYPFGELRRNYLPMKSE